MKHKPVKQSSFYSVKEGKVERLRKACPRCGDGTWMAFHKNRYYCGKCGYTEFIKESKQG